MFITALTLDGRMLTPNPCRTIAIAVAKCSTSNATGRVLPLARRANSVGPALISTRSNLSAFSGKVRFHFDDGDAAQRLQLDALLAAPRPGAHLYVCGPKGFMDAVLAKARAAGWPQAQLHYEFFAAEVVKSESDEGFEVQLASSGKVVRVGKDVTVIQALASAGIEVPTSCEQGVCGTCLTRVLEGQPDHRDMYLTPEEQRANDQFPPCCSRSKSARLVLDL